MANDSTTGGYLQPVSTAPAFDLDLDAILQSLVTGITGLDGSLVRPRWQPVVPKDPEAAITWASVGITQIVQDGSASIVHHSDGNGTDEMRQQDMLTVLVSVYGPACYGTACLLRDGLFIAQNREAIQLQGLAFVDCEPIRQIPDLINQTFRRRADLTLRFRRATSRTYAIENVLEATGTIATDTGLVEPFDTANATSQN